jgi:hypothetical protein
MANQNGHKYGFTALFPILGDRDCIELRTYLRSLSDHPNGSPLSALPMVHMARFAIINQFALQDATQPDRLKSPYLLFACQFDGAALSDLTTAIVAKIPDVLCNIWRHCFGLCFETPAGDQQSVEAVTAYFERCQLPTDLFLADQPEASVAEILKALWVKQKFSEFIARNQGEDAHTLQRAFAALWNEIKSAEAPQPGTI